MRVPVEWLHQYCAPSLGTAALAERLAMTGTDVERVERHGVGTPQQFVVGRVLEANEHPDAERLKVCLVDVGGPQPSQVVCGAPNVQAGQTVAVAKPGAVMPDGSTLSKVQLRGVESDGMILAEDELAIGSDHAGILVLEQDATTPGTPLEELIAIATDVFVLEITPNRPDCLGIYGVAREAHAATGAELEAPPWSEDPGSDGPLEEANLVVECPDLCPRFTARVFDEVKIGPSPPWLKARLMAAGQRPISNVVDITNYVMLLAGQPLHAFDLERVAGSSLTVRRAGHGETVRTLDGQLRELDSEMVLIEDAEGPTSIAGVMGGARSEVQPDTSRVLMEAACWDGPNIHRTSLKLGLRSEASGRFEKQLQPEQAMQALALASALMVDVCGAKLAPGTIDVGGPGPEPQTIRLRDQRVSGILGAPIPRQRCREILQSLEFNTSDAADGLDVKVPAFRRADVTREADLIEEVARLEGFDNLPATLPSRHGASGRLTATQRRRRLAVDLLAAQGLSEVVGWSFVSDELAARLRIDGQPSLELANPLSAEQSRLRTTLLGSLLDVARRNRAHGASSLRLFEAGAIYLPAGEDQLPHEPFHVAALLGGPVRRPTWRDAAPQDSDFYAAKGVLAALLGGLGVPWTVRPAEQPFLHPGRSAAVLAGESPAGWIGELHPQLAAEWELDGPIAAFELDLDALPEPELTVYEDLTSLPELRQDLAVVVPEQVSAADVLGVVRGAGKPLLASADVFDVYRDSDKLGASNKSLALRLAFRAPDRTLTDEEVAEQRRAIVAALSGQLGGSIRES
jgi:phenylalanyl-tRNA synthetase beta chain